MKNLLSFHLKIGFVQSLKKWKMLGKTKRKNAENEEKSQDESQFSGVYTVQ